MRDHNSPDSQVEYTNVLHLRIVVQAKMADIEPLPQSVIGESATKTRRADLSAGVEVAATREWPLERTLQRNDLLSAIVCSGPPLKATRLH